MGLTQEGLAELAACSRNYLILVESGSQNLTIDSYVRIAAAVKYKPSELFRHAGL